MVERTNNKQIIRKKLCEKATWQFIQIVCECASERIYVKFYVIGAVAAVAVNVCRFCKATESADWRWRHVQRNVHWFVIVTLIHSVIA